MVSSSIVIITGIGKKPVGAQGISLKGRCGVVLPAACIFLKRAGNIYIQKKKEDTFIS